MAQILEPGTGVPRGRRRLIHTSDMGSHFGQGTWLFGDPAEPDHLRKWIRNLAAGGADTYVPEVYFDGLIAYYRSRRCPNWKSPAFARFDAMMDGGVMPLDIFVDEARNQGIELLAGFRMNDRHGINKPFFEAHPDWILKDLGHGVDYSLPEVRDWVFSIIQEVPERFAGIVRAAGSCYLYPAIQADVPGNCAIMTLDNYRAAVRNFYEAGADGVSTHNYDVYMWGRLRSQELPRSRGHVPEGPGVFQHAEEPRCGCRRRQTLPRPAALGARTPPEGATAASTFRITERP